MDICLRVGKNINALRKARGYSQEELALRANLERSYLSQIENGKRNMTLLMLADIAGALKVKPVELLAEK